MSKVMQGKVRGWIIELSEDPGLAEGQAVEVSMRTLPARQTWGDGLRRCAGALAHEWTDEDDRILAEIHDGRRRDTRGEISE